NPDLVSAAEPVVETAERAGELCRRAGTELVSQCARVVAGAFDPDLELMLLRRARDRERMALPAVLAAERKGDELPRGERGLLADRRGWDLERRRAGPASPGPGVVVDRDHVAREQLAVEIRGDPGPADDEEEHAQERRAVEYRVDDRGVRDRDCDEQPR